jgi:hypothetical protein
LGQPLLSILTDRQTLEADNMNRFLDGKQTSIYVSYGGKGKVIHVDEISNVYSESLNSYTFYKYDKKHNELKKKNDRSDLVFMSLIAGAVILFLLNLFVGEKTSISHVVGSFCFLDIALCIIWHWIKKYWYVAPLQRYEELHPYKNGTMYFFEKKNGNTEIEFVEEGDKEKRGEFWELENYVNRFRGMKQ